MGPPMLDTSPSVAENKISMTSLGLELNSDRYVQLLRKLIGETEHLQNNPPRFIPEEDK